MRCFEVPTKLSKNNTTRNFQLPCPWVWRLANKLVFGVNPMSSQMEVLLDRREQPSQAYASSLVANNMRMPAMRPALAMANDPA